MRKLVSILILLTLLIPPVFAVPATVAIPAGNIEAGKVLFNATGGAGTGWFEWGSISGSSYTWTTPNQTITDSVGRFNDTQWGPPLLSEHTYYVRACDSSGCDATDESFTTPEAKMINQTWFGYDMITLKRTGFNITQAVPIILSPYVNVFKPWGTGAAESSTLVWVLLFLFIFMGMWIRQRNVTIICMISFVTGAVIWGTGGLGFVPEAISIGQGLMIASIAGIIMSWVSK